MGPIDLWEVTNRSSHHVTLNMIILHRNWTKVVHSTALVRKFGTVARKVNELKSSAIVLSAQLSKLPLCTWRTFDSDDYSTEQQEAFHEAFANYFQTSITRVNDVFEKHISPQNKTKYDTLWSPDDLLYVRDAFERHSVKHLWGLLTEHKYKLLTNFGEVGCELCRSWGQG